MRLISHLRGGIHQAPRSLSLTIGATLAGLMLAATAQCAEITVSAASSLTEAFKRIANSYQATYPDAKVRLNFGASGLLLQQLTQGAPVDVLASADEATMDTAHQRGLLRPGSRRDFARNRLVVITPIDSRLAINRLDDLATKPVQRIAIGNPDSVPVGRYALETLSPQPAGAAILAKTIKALNVRQVLDYVARAEVDAGLVYASDAALMPQQVQVRLTLTTPTPIVYPIAVTNSNPKAADEAQRFVQYVRSPEAQAILEQFGFLPIRSQTTTGTTPSTKPSERP